MPQVEVDRPVSVCVDLMTDRVVAMFLLGSPFQVSYALSAASARALASDLASACDEVRPKSVAVRQISIPLLGESPAPLITERKKKSPQRHRDEYQADHPVIPLGASVPLCLCASVGILAFRHSATAGFLRTSSIYSLRRPTHGREKAGFRPCGNQHCYGCREILRNGAQSPVGSGVAQADARHRAG